MHGPLNVKLIKLNASESKLCLFCFPKGVQCVGNHYRSFPN
jgi:hypothetical protein